MTWVFSSRSGRCHSRRRLGRTNDDDGFRKINGLWPLEGHIKRKMAHIFLFLLMLLPLLQVRSIEYVCN